MFCLVTVDLQKLRHTSGQSCKQLEDSLKTGCFFFNEKKQQSGVNTVQIQSQNQHTIVARQHRALISQTNHECRTTLFLGKTMLYGCPTESKKHRAVLNETHQIASLVDGNNAIPHDVVNLCTTHLLFCLITNNNRFDAVLLWHKYR